MNIPAHEVALFRFEHNLNEKGLSKSLDFPKFSNFYLIHIFVYALTIENRSCVH